MLSSLLRGQLTLSVALPMIFAVVISIFVLLPFHECAHAGIAYLLGDRTAKLHGRLTLNPLSHIDPFGALMLLLFGYGWARPVPVDARNFKRERSGMALVALAGPLADLFIAYIVTTIFMCMVHFGLPQVLGASWQFLTIFMQFAIILAINSAVFNLLPVPPLDGSKILALFLPQAWLQKYFQYQRQISFMLMLLFFTGILAVPMVFLRTWVHSGVMFLAGLPF